MRSFAAYLTEVSQAEFIEVGDLQRGEPERAMLRAQHLLGGGVMNLALEHIGDLTHRMSEKVTWRNAGYEYVKEKVEKAIRWLSSGYGFDREFQENLKNNADFRHVPYDEFRKKVYQALDEYADAHKALPYYNRAQMCARDAAIALGERRFDECLSNLREIQGHLGSIEEWVKWAHRNVDLTESKQDAAMEFVQQVRPWPNTGYRLELRPAGEYRPNEVFIEHLEVCETGQGAGSVLLQRLCDLADTLHVRLSLNAQPQGPNAMPRRKLIQWYRSFGFRGPGDALVRKPQRGSLTEEKIDALLRIPAELAGEDYAPITDFLVQAPADFDTRQLALATLHDVEVKLLPTYPERLLIADIIPTQESVYLPNLTDMLNHVERVIHEKPILVMRYQGQEYCLDGHHRLVALSLSGYGVIGARIVNV